MNGSDYYSDKRIRRLFPRLLPWIEGHFDHAVEKLTFTLITEK